MSRNCFWACLAMSKGNKNLDPCRLVKNNNKKMLHIYNPTWQHWKISQTISVKISKQKGKPSKQEEEINYKLELKMFKKMFLNNLTIAILNKRGN